MVCCRCLYACGRKEKKKKKLRFWATIEKAKWVLGKKNLIEPKQNLRQATDAYMRVGEKRKKQKNIVGYHKES